MEANLDYLKKTDALVKGGFDNKTIFVPNGFEPGDTVTIPEKFEVRESLIGKDKTKAQYTPVDVIDAAGNKGQRQFFPGTFLRNVSAYDGEKKIPTGKLVKTSGTAIEAYKEAGRVEGTNDFNVQDAVKALAGKPFVIGDIEHVFGKKFGTGINGIPVDVQMQSVVQNVNFKQFSH